MDTYEIYDKIFKHVKCLEFTEHLIDQIDANAIAANHPLILSCIYNILYNNCFIMYNRGVL